MDEFEVFIERPAEQDLLALLNYITHILKEPDTAKYNGPLVQTKLKKIIVNKWTE